MVAERANSRQELSELESEQLQATTVITTTMEHQALALDPRALALDPRTLALDLQAMTTHPAVAQDSDRQAHLALGAQLALVSDRQPELPQEPVLDLQVMGVGQES